MTTLIVPLLLPPELLPLLPPQAAISSAAAAAPATGTALLAARLVNLTAIASWLWLLVRGCLSTCPTLLVDRDMKEYLLNIAAYDAARGREGQDRQDNERNTK
jgi:hypothetical protein